ncbi:MAG: VWA domain-containing protein [Planctomycetota bacterium]
MIGLQTPLALLVVVPLLYLWWRLGRGPRQVWAVRIAVLVLCALVLASPVVSTRRGGGHVVFLVDRSLSAGAEAVRTGAEMLAAAESARAKDDRVSLVLFGDGASALFGSSNLPSELKASKLDDASDLHAGLALAGSLSAAGGRGRVFLISDGLYTGPDPGEQIPELRKKGISVDFWPVQKAHENDAAITRVELPERVRVRQPFEVAFAVYAPQQCDATVRVKAEGAAFEQKVSIKPGENRFAFKHELGSVGLASYLVTASVGGDTRPENNRAAAVTEAVGPAEVLVLTSTGRPDNLTRALAASGMLVRVRGDKMSVSSAALKSFRAVVVENVALSSLNDRADAAMHNYVTEMGGGLLVTGGQNSYAAGGYYQSRLEPILPVSMERKDEFRRTALAMGIVLDRSGSMTMPVGGGRTKMDLANRAAAEAVALLDDQDEIAVFAVDSEAHRVVELVRLADKRSGVRKKILSIESMGGGIFVYVGLRAAVSELVKSKAPTRHIVLFSDAQDSEEPGGYKNLIDTWAKAGGTISVIGLGQATDCDAELLKDIAKRGNGTIMFTTDPNALPRIFCQDAMRIARKTFVEEKVAARVTPAIAQFGRLGIRSFPSFLGYNLCYPRKEAAQAVITTDENAAPVLAAWQRGLGRVAALTCEADGSYSGDLGKWPEYKPFFSSLVKWLQKDREDPSLFGSIVREGRTAHVLLEMDAAAARKCTGAAAMIFPPDESKPVKLPLQWTSPETMRASFRLRQNGIYHGLIITREGKRIGLPPVVLPYSPEFEPSPRGAGVGVLKQLAEATGGQRIMHVKELFERRDPALETRTARASLAPHLAALAILLLLCDIITRRALWAHIIPQSLRKRPAAARERLAAVPAQVRTRLARSRRRAGPQPAPGAAQTEEPEAAEERGREEKKESVFKKAKRRSRT